MCLFHLYNALRCDPQRRLGLYVDCNSTSIIRYLEPQTGDVFTTQFADCHFDEKEFRVLGEKIKR